MTRLLPALKIHTWGGLGSQLFSVAIATEILRRFPRRSIVIVLHTGGVTRRLPEVVQLYPEFEYRFVDDHTNLHTSPLGSSKSVKLVIFKILKTLFGNIGLILNSNSDFEFDCIRPWTLSLRGHYSYRSITGEFLRSLDLRLQKMYPRVIEGIESALCLHYRLGDLLDLEEKSPLPSVKILEQIEDFLRDSKERNVILFSDSTEEALQRLQGNNSINFIVSKGDTTEVMRQAAQSLFFIGTSSKVSFWVAAIRGTVYRRKSSLPLVNQTQYHNMLRSDLNQIIPFG